MSYSIKRDPILDVKYTFLRFLQAYFKADPTYTWDYDVRTSKIFILDKHAVDLGVTLKRPAIILNRNNFSWSYASGNQNAVNTRADGTFTKLMGDAPNVGLERTQTYSDLLVGNLVFTVLSKNGLEAERLASRIFTLFTAHKDDLRIDGLHKVTNLSVGGEQIVRQSSEQELVAVNVSLTYYKQQVVKKDETYHELIVYMDGVILDQSLDYDVELNGQYIVFLRDIPDGAIITVDYIDALTLEEIESVALEPTADPQRFKIANDGTILGFYVVVNNIELEVEVDEYE
jgi:hypothetical protein